MNNDDPIVKPGRFIVGHGLDVVDIVDFARITKGVAHPHLNRHFTASELTAAGEGVNQVEKLAGRFAVKEAVLKALGVGWGDGVAFTDVEVRTLDSGAPTVSLFRKLKEVELERGIVGWLVSISHTSTVAVASVIALSSGGENK
jgi:holo-[acyl-carrier protein] synthase